MAEKASTALHFAINHMVAPQLELEAFFALARELGLGAVEIRNDIAGRAIADGTAAATVKAAASRAGVAILTINALQRFNEWTPARAKEASALAAYARECGAAALILVPTNDGSGRADGVRQQNLATALAGLQPILSEAGITGLVEPLGFETCSLRLKREAVEGIRAAGGEAQFKVTHDTFHHYLAGETELFPAATGLVHISGVDDASVAVAEMRDSHRVLVGPRDRLGNIAQLVALRRGGYSGPLSFEPFAEQLRRLASPAAAIARSMEFITAELMRQAA